MLEDKNRLKIIFIIAGLTLLLALPRFKHYVAPDSVHYVELASFFAGDLDKGELRSPFAYRVLVPFLAALGPNQTLALNIAIINIFFTAAAFVMFYFYLQQLLTSQSQINLGLLLLIVAFPTVNYASGVMTDAAGFFFFVLAAYLFLTRHYLLYSGALVLGVLAREAIISQFIAVTVYILLCYWYKPQKKCQPGLLLVFIPPALAVLGVRFFFSDLPSFIWHPSWQQFIFTVSRPVAWATFLLTLLPPLLLLILAYRRQTVPVSEVLRNWSFETKAWLAGLIAAGLALNLYSITSAALSGRFVWPFYVVLVPLAAAFFRNDGSWLFSFLDTVASKIFGGGSQTNS